MLALLVGLIEIGLGLGKLGFVADLLSSEVQVGYMNGLAITIIVGQLPKLFGFSTDADSFVDELRAFVEPPRRDPGRARCSSGVGVLLVLLVLPRHHPDRTRGAGRGRRRDDRVRRARPRRRRAWRRSARSRVGSRSPSLPWTSLSDVGPLAARRHRHRAGVAHRHHRHRVELRGAPRRRARAQPGDDRHRRRQRGRRLLPGVRRSPPAGRAPRSPSSRAPRARSPASSARRCSSCCCCSSTRCSPTCRSRRSRPW